MSQFNFPKLPSPTPAPNNQRPSDGWLRNPSWIDGAVNPPRFYHSHDEIHATLLAWGIMPHTRPEVPSASVTPTPAAPIPSVPLDFSLVDEHEVAPPAPVAPTGHLVNVTLVYTAFPAGNTSGRGKATPKKAKITKMDTISFEGITRVDFIAAFLAIHGLSERFSPGVHSGPDFKMWWTGATGGKGGAPSIQTDHHFEIALQAMLKKDKIKTQVFVEFDTDGMDGYRIKQTLPAEGSAAGAGEDELAYGTRVPQVQNFSDESQLNGRFIIELKKKWPCQTHQGEHGEAGHCYVSPTGEHTRLDTIRLKAWSSAIAAGDATRHEPPNIAVFDGARDGRLIGLKSRGRTGPYAARADPSTGQDAFALVLAALLPNLLGRKRGRSSSDVSDPPFTPKRVKPSTPAATPTMYSPMPEKGLELRACLRDFAELHGHDLTEYEIPLRLEDYSADIIPFVDDSVLGTLTGATPGVVIKLKRFCKEWFSRYEKKLHSAK